MTLAIAGLQGQRDKRALGGSLFRVAVMSELQQQVLFAAREGPRVARCRVSPEASVPFVPVASDDVVPKGSRRSESTMLVRSERGEWRIKD